MLSCSLVWAPPSADNFIALDNSLRADLIRSPFPSAMAAPESTSVRTAPLPLPSPPNDVASRSTMSSVLVNSTGVLVRVNPMVAWS